MQENDKNGPLQDDEAKKRLQGELRSNRVEERELEPSGEDQPDVDLDPHTEHVGGTPPGMTPRDVALRAELARYLGRHVYPADRATVLEALRSEHAPDQLVGLASRLPEDGRFANAQELAQALGLGTETRRT
ncbi:DUF2795 domain-containing protein [Streptomyces sp. NPDC054796]